MLLAILLLAGAPFWETKPPDQWTEDELFTVLGDSPWVTTAGLSGALASVPGVRVYLASAKPMQDAEEETRSRQAKRRATEYVEDDDYRDFLRENPGKYIVLAVVLTDPQALADARESARMEEECQLRIGRRKHKLVGHFPPTPSDPYLRLIFPRAIEPDTKTLRFELYLPSVPAPYRNAEFHLPDLLYKGTPEM